MYKVNIEIGANASKYWASIEFVDKAGTRHSRRINQDRTASQHSNFLEALIEAVDILNYPCMLNVYTSSEYIIEPFKQGWIWNWEKNGWTNAKGNIVRNAEQWKRVRNSLAPHSVRFYYSGGKS